MFGGIKQILWIYPLVCVLYLLNSQNLVSAGSPVPMTILQSAVAKGAVCLDGSPPAYHLDRGFGSGVNNWLVLMEGGGWCRNVDECLARRDTYVGSSRHMPPTSFGGILGNLSKGNPEFYNWNRVKIRYCDGSSFTGDVETVDPKTNLYYRGARVWLAIIEDLLAEGMRNAEQAILSGCSAGGLASILHCDKFRSLLPPTAKVKCVSDAGYFIDLKDISGQNLIRKYYNDVVTTHGSAPNLPSSCTSKLSPNLCFFPQYVVPYMQTPLFILNAAYDAWQIQNIFIPTSADPSRSWADCRLDLTKCTSAQIETIQGFRSEFLLALSAPQISSSMGLFIDSCYAHCQSGQSYTWLADNSTMVGNMRIANAIGDWYNDRNAIKKIDCAYPCNLSCYKQKSILED